MTDEIEEVEVPQPEEPDEDPDAVTAPDVRNDPVYE